jgi:SPP1 gp7 family putative phage head morphogenesis protein
MASKPKTLPAARPNVGIRTAYQKRLETAVDDMTRSVIYWLRANYRANPPELAQDLGGVLSMDASPAREMERAMRLLARRWNRNFDKLAVIMAEHFAKAVADRSDRALMAALRKYGFTVRFRMTATQNDVLQATIAENVQLIRSIPSQYFTQVQGDVMRAIQSGRDLATLTDTLERRTGITRRRAAFIARDQTNKATAALTRVRQQEVGVTKAVWLHSGGGKEPRPEHVAFSGQTYDVAKGAFLEGKWTWPGVEPNCRCVSKAVVPGFDS